MILKTPNLSAASQRLGAMLKNPFVRIGLAAICIVAATAILYSNDKLSSGQGGLLDNFWDMGYRVPSDLRGKVPIIHLQIKDKHLQMLKSQTIEAKQNKGVLNTLDGDDNFVPAVIKHGETISRAEIRLKGNLTGDRFENKLSIRTMLKDDKTILGMQRFSMHSTQAKSNISEWVFHELLKHHGLVALRYHFVQLYVNNQSLGIHALEEHFDKRLLANNNRREGPIVRFDETWLYKWHLHKFKDNATTAPLFISEAWSFSPTMAYGTNKNRHNPMFAKQFRTAVQLIERFKQGQLKASQVFNVKDLAMLTAINEVIGNRHSLFHRNIKFFLNPVTNKIDPVGYDSHMDPTRLSFFNQLLPNTMTYTDRKKDPKLIWLELLFRDPEFFKEYNKALEIVAAPNYLENFYAKVKQEYHDYIRVIQLELPPYRADDFEIMSHNVDVIRRHLHPKGALQVFYKGKANNTTTLQVRNFHTLPVEVFAININGNDIPLKPTFVSQKPFFDNMPIYEIKVPGNYTSEQLRSALLQFRMAGTQTTLSEKINWWAAYENQFAATDLMRAPANHKDFGFLQVDENKKLILIPPGNHTVNKPMIIPEGYLLVAQPGAKLDIINKAVIISRSAIYFDGTEANAIFMNSSDSTGHGLVVLNSDVESRMNYVAIRNLRPPKVGTWELTGVVTFYENNVRFNNVLLAGNHGEDSLNIIRSEFAISGLTIDKAAGDALDIDFGKGSIVNSKFINSGNDAIDISGTVAQLNNIDILSSQDKAISAGELSTLHGSNIRVNKFNIGVASKDKSQVFLSQLSLQNGKYGLTAFQKKPEFGPGKMEVTGIQMSNITDPSLIEEGSVINVDSKILKALYKNVRSKLYPEED